MQPVVPVEEQVDYIIMKHTSPIATQIDPRSEIETQEEPEKSK